MRALAALRTMLAALLRRRALDRELEDEVRFHIESERQYLEQRGLAADTAARQAIVNFGGVQEMREQVHDAQGARWIETARQDIRYAARTLGRRPAFTLVATLTLALGIGATTALFSVVKAVLLSPLPYREPERIAVVWSSWKGFPQTWLSYDEYEAYETEIPAFENVALFSDGALNITEGDEPERLRSGSVQHDLFAILGVSPALGRVFTADEDKPNGPTVVMLSHALWKRRYAGDSAIVGRTIQLNGRAATVVGVMPSGFKLPLDFGADGATEIWQPMQTDAADNGATPGPAFTPGGGSHGYYAVARLRPGATAAAANAQLQRLFSGLGESFYPATMQFRAFVTPVEEQVSGRIRPVLLVVFGAVGFVLLIACANVAGLLLVRGETRRRELAVRVALGANGARLTRQLFTESLVLALCGGTVGIGLAALAVWMLRRFAPADLPRVTEAALDPWVLLFAVGSTVIAAMLAGTLPALQASGSFPAEDLKDGGRGATSGVARLRWRQALVATEIAFAVVLVSGAGLMTRTVANLFAVRTGFDASNVLTMRMSTPVAFYEDSIKVATFHARLAREIAALPGVQSEGTARLLPLASEMGDWGITVQGYEPPPNQGTPSDWQVVTPGYFETMRVPLVQGRYIDDRDGMSAPLSLVVNREFVSRYVSGREPLGVRVRIGGSPDTAWYTIVGVVDNVHHNGLTREVKAQFYAPLAQFARAPGNTTRGFNLVVRSSTDPESLVPAVRAVIRHLDPRIPVSQIRTMDDVVATSISQPRFAMTLLGLFSVLALALSAIGIFGIVAQLVAARSHEFGIRAALGASPRSLVVLSMKGGFVQTAIGLAAGVVLSLLFTRTLGGLLQGVSPTDPLTFVAVVGVTAVVALVATIGPAWRAARADPLQTLHEG